MTNFRGTASQSRSDSVFCLRSLRVRHKYICIQICIYITATCVADISKRNCVCLPPPCGFPTRFFRRCRHRNNSWWHIWRLRQVKNSFGSRSLHQTGRTQWWLCAWATEHALVWMRAARRSRNQWHGGRSVNGGVASEWCMMHRTRNN